MCGLLQKLGLQPEKKESDKEESNQTNILKTRKEVEDRLDKLIDISGTAMRVIDTDFNIVYQNKKMEEWTGVTDEEIKDGIKCYEQLSGAYCNTENCTLEQIMEHDAEEIEVEIEKTTREGDKINTKLTSGPINDENGELIAIAESFSDRTDIKDTVNQVKEVTEKLSNGNLAIDLDKTGLEGDHLEIVKSLNHVVKKIREDMIEIRNSAKEVNDASEEIAATAEEMNSASTEISESIQEISRGSAKQSEMTDELASKIEDSTANTEESSAQAEEIADEAEKVSKDVNDAKNQSTEISEMINTLRETLKETNQKAGKLEEHSEQIEGIVGTISEIAEQTNLLALNASIEAARAGEHGKGFAVVADEVKNLAEETQKETENIREVIQENLNYTSAVVKEIGEVDEKAQKVDKLSEGNLEKMKGIDDSIDSVSSAVKEISKAVGDLAEAMQEAAHEVDDVRGIAVDNVKETEQTAAAAEEQDTSVESLTSAAEQLSALASDLTSMVKEYKLNE